MIHGLLGKKLGMSQIFDETGNVIPVTIVEAGPCYITQLKTTETDGYNALQIGFERQRKNVKKPMQGHFKKSKVPYQRHLRELRIPEFFQFNTDEYQLGSMLTVNIFEAGDVIDVVGKTKGKGFQGTIKRHNFSRGPESHGSMNVRRPGAIGQCAYPSRVFKGKKMSGQMGNKIHTVKNLEIVRVDEENNLLFIRGGIPGSNGTIVFVRDARTGSRKEQKERPLVAVSADEQKGAVKTEEN